MKKSSRSQTHYGPLPLVVGITGHRDPLPDDLPRLRSELRSVFQTLRARFPHTPIRLLTLLAAGADSLATEVAFDVGLEVFAVLPLVREDYRSDFSDPSDRDRFDRLHGRCARVFTMPPLAGSSREAHYAAAGAFMIRHCQVLVALWDGRDTGLLGGTADIVRTQLHAGHQGSHRHGDDLGGRMTGPVFWVPTRRIRAPEATRPEPEGLPFPGPSEPFGADSSVVIVYPMGWGSVAEARDHYQHQHGRFEMFNRDCLRLKAPLEPAVPLDLAGLLRQADALAERFQGWARGSLLALVVLGTATFGLMVVFDELAQFLPVLFGFFGALAASWVLYSVARKKAWDGKYFDYRTLAELVRVMGHLGSVGLVPDPTDLTTPKQQSLLPWVAAAARTTAFPLFFDQTAPVLETCHRLLRDWIQGKDGQRCYYEEGIAKREASLKVRKRIRFGLFAGALAAAGGFVAVKVAALIQGIGGTDWWDFRCLKSNKGLWGDLVSWLQAAFDLLLSSGTGLALYMDIRAYEDEIRLFERGRIVFTRAERLMTEALAKNDLALFRAIALDLAQEAVGEHFEWNNDHRSVPLEMPMG